MIRQGLVERRGGLHHRHGCWTGGEQGVGKTVETRQPDPQTSAANARLRLLLRLPRAQEQTGPWCGGWRKKRRRSSARG